MNPLEPYLAYIRYALIAIIPALVIYLMDHSTIESLKSQLANTEANAAPPAATHILTLKDAADIMALESSAALIAQTIDQYKPSNNNINELICMQGMRNSAASYLANMINQVQQQMAMAVNGKDQADVKYADTRILGTVSSTLNYVPTIKQTLQQMTRSCSASQTVSYTNSTITRFLDTKMFPAFISLKTRLAKAK